ncbi:uncharacterized protein (DUF58 family) [Saccharothrix ecbatanensis]|uniref:Uncharacterized protein (DUF58 family) n=1 Tax=Saccharothrix ecbatanensis TaxID=1105145 RepID=A0A7W9M511_9PSEU|nr:DUF58 domain-containing protein [Saccharothrix ecbatanensis]MBB5807598.1 uncharacterized protein (DUF58 family) [Saccharothrix ecbatanensis]
MTRAQRLREAFTSGRGAHWHPTDALVRGLALGVGMVVLGGLLHEVELVLFGAPLLISTLLALITPVTGTPTVKVHGLPRTGEIGAAKSIVEVDPGTGAEVLAIRLPDPVAGGIGVVHLMPATAREIDVVLRRDAWGEGVDLRPDHLVAGPDALFVHGPITAVERGRVILPPVEALPAGLLPARAVGLVGAHRARRPGDSVELRDIRAFQPGDRLRRIDWRVSLRTSAMAGTAEGTYLHVREHHAEADADVVLALDTRQDVGAELGEWATPARATTVHPLGRSLGEWSLASRGTTVRPGGSLDLAVRAAASLGAGYLRQGDRVGLVDLGRPQLGARPGVGRRQLLRLRNQLVVCARSAGWAQRPVLRPEQVPHGALVVVLSPFLDAEVVELAVHAARRGNLVLAVDVLPQPLRPDPEARWGVSALKVIRLEHDVRLEAMRQHGVAVVPWGAPIAGVLRQARTERRLSR